LNQVPCLPAGGDSCRDYNKLLTQVPCLPKGGDSRRDYNKLLIQVPCLPAGGDSCRDYKEVDLKVILTFNSTSFILEIVKTAVNPAVNDAMI
jgi:hypothetical protein